MMIFLSDYKKTYKTQAALNEPFWISQLLPMISFFVFIPYQELVHVSV